MLHCISHFTGESIVKEAKDKIISQITRSIEKRHWTVMGVFPTSEDIPGDHTTDGLAFAYTIGLTSLGLPELFMCGPFDIAAMANILNSAGEKMRAEQQPLPVDVPIEGLIHIPLMAQDVPDDAMRKISYLAHDHYGKPLAFQQIIWPDENNRFPADTASQFTLNGKFFAKQIKIVSGLKIALILLYQRTI